MKKRSSRKKPTAMVAAGIVALCAVTATINTAHAAAKVPTPPNVVTILVDDMGWSDLGCYGGEIPTPNLDRLAANGLRFTQFYNTARCSPSRAALLTGLYPHRAGMGYLDNLIVKGSEGTTGRLSDRAVTMAEALKPAGYFTAMAGKWHVGQNHGTPPWQRGFERSLSSATGAIYFPGQREQQDKPIALNGTPLPLSSPVLGKNWYSTSLWKDFGLRFVDEALQEKKPFFLYVAYCAPHFPLMAPQQDIARYKGKYMAGWDKLREARYRRQIKMGLIDRKWPLSQRPTGTPAWDSLSPAEKERLDNQMAVYAAMIDTVDKSVGMLVEGLRKRGALNNTLILFMSDNGGNAETGPRGIAEGEPLGGPQSKVYLGMNWATLNNTPFRRFKHFTHEGGISTPLIVHWPAGIARKRNGQLEKQPAHLVDIMATVMDVTGTKYPTTFNGRDIYPMDGTSLRPTFTGQTLKREKPIFWEHEGNRGVRSGKWKLVSKYLDSWELYDIEADRTEQRDLATQNPQLADELAAQWDTWARQSLVDPWSGPRRADWGDPTRELAGDVGSKAMVFDLQRDNDLPREQAPRIAGRNIHITAKLGAQHGDGVIVAQGGVQEGYALYVKDGRLEVATRSGGKMTVVTAPDTLAAGPVTVMALLAKDGTCTLQVAGNTVVSGKMPQSLQVMPVDGLQVGRDLKGLVGRYENANRFDGIIESVRIELKD